MQRSPLLEIVGSAMKVADKGVCRNVGEGGEAHQVRKGDVNRWRRGRYKRIQRHLDRLMYVIAREDRNNK